MGRDFLPIRRRVSDRGVIVYDDRYGRIETLYAYFQRFAFFFSMGIDEFNGGSPIASRSLFTVFLLVYLIKKTASSSGFSIRIHPWLMALFVRLKACLLLVSCR